MDNFYFTVSGSDIDLLSETLNLALKLRGHNKFTHYLITDNHGIILFWLEPKDLVKELEYRPLPYVMDKQAAIDFIRNWLRSGAKYGPRPDTDGESERGWLVYVDDWGHIAGSHYASIAVKPLWAVYGK